MMDITLSILALIAGGVTLELFAAARPAMAHHDEQVYGLAHAADEASADYCAGNPS